MSEPLYDLVVITSDDSTASRVMLGASVSNLNAGATTAQQGLLVPAEVPTTLPQLIATVYYGGVALDPQPTVLWELSCGQNIATIDQSGNITRQVNPNAASFDSNGLPSIEQIGGLIQVSATVLRADGSQSGVRGVLNITIQNSASKQFGLGLPIERFKGPAANNSPESEGFFNLVDPALVGENYSN
jgi:hypothetical protein